MNHSRRKFRKFNHKLPERWNDYTAMGKPVAGTRFLPFKTPLKEEICRKSLTDNDNTDWFTPAMLLERAPNLKLVIDLTQTDRYYSGEDLIKNGVRHKKIYCRGGGKELPPGHIIHEFNKTIDSFLQSEDAVDTDALIGVHCTHGLNRTGYLICKYMVQHNGIPATEAVEAFESARGHKMERDLYVNDILGKCEPPARHRQSQKSSRARVGTSHAYHSYSPLDTCYEEDRPSRWSRPYVPPYRRNGDQQNGEYSNGNKETPSGRYVPPYRRKPPS